MDCMLFLSSLASDDPILAGVDACWYLDEGVTVKQVLSARVVSAAADPVSAREARTSRVIVVGHLGFESITNMLPRDHGRIPISVSAS